MVTAPRTSHLFLQTICRGMIFAHIFVHIFLLHLGHWVSHEIRPYRVPLTRTFRPLGALLTQKHPASSGQALLTAASSHGRAVDTPGWDLTCVSEAAGPLPPMLSVELSVWVLTPVTLKAPRIQPYIVQPHALPKEGSTMVSCVL